MAYEEKRLAGENEGNLPNPQADPQENFLHPPKNGPEKKRMSEDTKEFEPVKDRSEPK